MLSAIFVDRPRLAIVIAIVITIAGALALLAIPFAQYPDKHLAHEFLKWILQSFPQAPD